MSDKIDPMIERMARAVARIEGELASEAGDFADWHWEEFEDHARAVLAAMREPTEAMWKAGNAERIADGDYLYAEDAWRAMIDAAAKG